MNNAAPLPAAQHAVRFYENDKSLAKIVAQFLSDGFAAGANDFMVKPISPAQLRTRVRTWLERLAASKQE